MHLTGLNLTCPCSAKALHRHHQMVSGCSKSAVEATKRTDALDSASPGVVYWR